MATTTNISNIENNDVPPIDKQNSITLELGDIIEIFAQSNPDLHEITAIITYIDNQKIKLLNVSTAKFYQLNIAENGQFTDESITQIHLLSRSEEPGFARQNSLLPKTWVDIHFGGEIPMVITGEITNLEEDMIEIITYPDMRVIYINFGYHGIPENIPIEKIVIRRMPASVGPIGSLSLIRQQLEEGEEYEVPAEDLASMEFTETGESILNIPEGAKPDVNIRDALHDLYIDANTIIFGEKLDEIVQLVEVPERQQRYGLDVQVNDLMDELLSVIPNSQRTKTVLDNIHLLIERFKELRAMFSKFDANENIYDTKTVGNFYKPLIDKIKRIDTNLRWIVPVVSNRRKIYDIEFAINVPDIVNDKITDGLRNIESMQTDYYKNNSKGLSLSYSAMYNNIQEWWNPTEPATYSTDQILTTSRVNTDLDTIVDNLEDFYSSVVNRSEVVKRKYVIQRYNLGLSQSTETVMNSGKTVYAQKQMTPNDMITTKSILMLPAPVVRFSTIDMPNTNIMEKTTLHQNYFMLFRLLRKKTEIIPHIIDDLSKEIDYDLMEKETKMEFLSGIHEFILDKEMYVDEDEKFNKFLETIIPNTRFLIRLVSKYVKNNVSLIDVVKQLEPFMVYSKDITYSHYKEIRYFIKNRILDYKKTYGIRSAEMAIIRTTKYNVNAKPNSILRLLSEKENITDSFLQSYHLLTESSTNGSGNLRFGSMFDDNVHPSSKSKTNIRLSPQEILLRMINMDNSNLYTNILTSIMISLITPVNFMNALDSANLDDVTDLERIKPTDCARRFLAKKYDSVKSLQKDNNVDELYYDKDMDDTPYSIMQKYKDDEKKMIPELFREFLIENLIHNHDCPKYMAGDLARTLISRKKLVVEGDYAVLELKPQLPESVDESKLNEREKESIEVEADIRKKIQYYRRLKNNWIKDDEIEDESFLDTNTIFCNVSANCYKNSNNNICETVDDAATRMKAIAKKKMVNEFDKRYSVNVDELSVELEKNIAYYMKLLNKTQILQEIQLYKANNLAYELGNLAATNDSIGSPYIKLRDLILGQDDFSKTQYDICRFIENYCRAPMINELNEHANWMYCKDTNTKLFPISIYELAKVFISGGDYQHAQSELCHRVGILSDDGDSIVDKHSGFIIRKLDFNNEEGFDISGFKITSYDILEQDNGLIADATVNNNERVFENETTEMIYKVFSSICSNIDIPEEGIVDFVLRQSSEMVNKDVYTEDAYEKLSLANFKKKGEYFKTTYTNYRNETLIIIIACNILVAVQTTIPSLQSKRTFPGCVRSFSGYPMNGIEDLTGIRYLACILNKTKLKFPPWESIHGYNVETLAKNMRNIIEKKIMNRNDITEMFVKKREYILLNPTLIAPEEHSISKWYHFLPPVVKFSILTKLRNIGNDFKDELMELMRKGSSDQHESIYVFKSRLVQFGYGIIESINNIVKNKHALLLTSGQIPFVENACCNDRDATNPLIYFNEYNNLISTYIKSAAQIAQILKGIRELSTASILYHPGFTGIRYPDVPIGQLEENIYAAVIWYCNLDRNLPVPLEYKSICNEMPDQYDPNGTIQEKIEFLKKRGKRYTAENLQQLMTFVNRKNIVNINSPETFTQVDVLKEIIEKLNMLDSTVIAEPLRKHLINVLDKYDPKKMVDIPSAELDELTEYLLTVNDTLYQKIMQFILKYGNLSKNKYNQLHDFLVRIQKWDLDRPMSKTKSYFDEGLYTVVQFIQNAILNITKMYPTILVNDADFFNKIPTHWGLSDKHERDLASVIDKYYDKLKQFKGDKVLLQLLQEVSVRLNELNLFAQNIPVHTEVVKEYIDADGQPQIKTFHSIFDKMTTYLLIVHCFYASIYEYILCSGDADLLRIDVQTIKKGRRTQISENVNKSNTFIGQILETDEDLIDYDDELQNVKIVSDNPEELKKRVCSLLLAFLDVEEDNKSAVNLSYDQILKIVNRSKEKEKQGFTTYLYKMSPEERGVEKVTKKYHLGRWNVGQQKGLVQYDKSTYDRERDELINTLMEEATAGTNDVVTAAMLDVYELEKQDDDEINEQYENGEYAIDDLGENYMDGEYYAEDRDPDDF